jgi:two-component system cell cycle response regulator
VLASRSRRHRRTGRLNESLALHRYAWIVPPPDRLVNVLAVGFDPGEVEGGVVELADDLLGGLARVADGGLDVVLLALDLPDEQGTDAVRAIRERAPDVPVIAIATNGDAEGAIDAGASDVVPADAGPELLARAIRYTTALHRMQAELHRHRVVDELSGLYNARGFEQLATHHLAMADRSKRPVPLVFVRIDALDDVDPAADDPDRARLIADAAEVVRDAVRGSDVIARVGAGVFCVLLTGDASGADAAVLSRMVEGVAESNAQRGHRGHLSVSVGTATYDPEHPVALGELITEADRRMRHAGGAE